MNARRIFGISEVAFGAILLAFPSTVAVKAAGREPPAPNWLVRVLGARLVGQGSWLVARTSDDVLAWGALVDAVHGSTMIVAAATQRSYRRSALSAAAVAAVSVAIGMAIRG